MLLPQSEYCAEGVDDVMTPTMTMTMMMTMMMMIIIMTIVSVEQHLGANIFKQFLNMFKTNV
jgi:hypothetical protein